MRIGVFPGQGVDSATILDSLWRSDPTVEQASEFLGFDLYKRVQTASRNSSVLDTSVAQPALFVASVVNWKRSVEQGARYDGFIGHSVGEYAALVAARSFSFEHGLCAVSVRAAAMAKAAKNEPGGMAAVLGLELWKVEELANSAGVSIANDNAPGQVVLAGPDNCLADVAASVSAEGGRCIRLKVSGPFHTNAMSEAVPLLSQALQHIWVMAPSVTVVSNITALPYGNAPQVRELLLRQLCERVRFRESVEYLHNEGAVAFDDLGPGRVVAGLVSRILEAAKPKAIVDA